MWVCFNDAFVSAVQDKNDPDRLCVRARNRSHLEGLFRNAEIVTTPNADYACRVFVSKSEFVEIVTQRIFGIDYTNFKDSVCDDRLHDLYAEFWQGHW